jgi:Ca2+/Na+ antiporter
MLACLVYIVVSNLTLGFNVGSVIFILALTIPLTVVLAVCEYRYAKFKTRPGNQRASRGPKEEIFWLVLTILAVGVWAYSHRSKPDFFLMLLLTWAFIRGWYFIIGSLNVQKRQPDKNV